MCKKWFSDSKENAKKCEKWLTPLCENLMKTYITAPVGGAVAGLLADGPGVSTSATTVGAGAALLVEWIVGVMDKNGGSEVNILKGIRCAVRRLKQIVWCLWRAKRFWFPVFVGLCVLGEHLFDSGQESKLDVSETSVTDEVSFRTAMFRVVVYSMLHVLDMRWHDEMLVPARKIYGGAFGFYLVSHLLSDELVEGIGTLMCLGYIWIWILDIDNTFDNDKCNWIAAEKWEQLAETGGGYLHSEWFDDRFRSPAERYEKACEDNPNSALAWWCRGVEALGDVTGNPKDQKTFDKCTKQLKRIDPDFEWDSLGFQVVQFAFGCMLELPRGYTPKECLQKALELDEDNLTRFSVSRWAKLAKQGGGIVKGKSYDTIQCLEKAENW